MQTMLANRYLDTEKAQSIIARGSQVNTQQQQVLSYQQGLVQLEANLMAERNTTLAELSETEWKTYKRQQIFSYRQAFFARSN